MFAKKNAVQSSYRLGTINIESSVFSKVFRCLINPLECVKKKIRAVWLTFHRKHEYLGKPNTIKPNAANFVQAKEI